MAKNVVKNAIFLSFGRLFAVPAVDAGYERGQETQNVKLGCEKISLDNNRKCHSCLHLTAWLFELIAHVNQVSNVKLEVFRFAYIHLIAEFRNFFFSRQFCS